MRYEEPRLLDLLAREYVLGTLHGRARARFERVLSSSLGARRSVIDWERRLVPLINYAVTPVTPADEIWPRIAGSLGIADKGKVRRGAGLWRAMAAGFALLALVFGSLYLTQQIEVERARYVTVVSDGDTGPVWLLQVFAETGELQANAIVDIPTPPGKSYELWMLPDDGTAPVSLGLIRGTGETRLPLTAGMLTILSETSTLAISLEPAGGSPTGAPTGPVIYTAPVLEA